MDRIVLWVIAVSALLSAIGQAIGIVLDLADGNGAAVTFVRLVFLVGAAGVAVFAAVQLRRPRPSGARDTSGPDAP